MYDNVPKDISIIRTNDQVASVYIKKGFIKLP